MFPELQWIRGTQGTLLILGFEPKFLFHILNYSLKIIALFQYKYNNEVYLLKNQAMINHNYLSVLFLRFAYYLKELYV